MKMMIASDLHGSVHYTNKLLQRFRAEGADQLMLLGDLYYHGPRNPFPKEYAPAELFELLNQNKDILRVVKGNCDSEVDQMVSEFLLEPDIFEVLGGKRFCFTHGHIYNQQNLPKDIDVIVYGHLHINFIKKVGDVWACNPGSVSLPKEGTPRGYLLTDGKVMTLKTLDGATVEEVIL